ncbi:MAG: glycosyltransferase family 2 protein [Gallionellaceae bacterium]
MKEQISSDRIERADVSVIVPCYRCIDTIRRAVDSILAQTALPQEIVLIDDFSDDGDLTINELKRLQQASVTVPIKLLCLLENGGPGSARNAGWEIASQPYLAFLDADDSWHPKKLALQFQWMLEHPGVVMSGHATLKRGLTDPIPDLVSTLTAGPVNSYRLLFKNYFPTRSVMLKRELPYRFVPGKRYAEDLLLWLTIALNGNSLWHLNLPLAYSYKEEFGDGGLTGDLWKAERGVQDTYFRLRNDKKISLGLYFLASIFSLFKYARRWLISKWRLV